MIIYMYSSTFIMTTADYFITLAVDKPFSFRLQFWVITLQGFNRHQSGGLYSQNDKQIPQRQKHAAKTRNRSYQLYKWTQVSQAEFCDCWSVSGSYYPAVPCYTSGSTCQLSY